MRRERDAFGSNALDEGDFSIANGYATVRRDDPDLPFPVPENEEEVTAMISAMLDKCPRRPECRSIFARNCLRGH